MLKYAPRVPETPKGVPGALGGVQRQSEEDRAPKMAHRVGNNTPKDALRGPNCPKSLSERSGVPKYAHPLVQECLIRQNLRRHNEKSRAHPKMVPGVGDATKDTSRALGHP